MDKTPNTIKNNESISEIHKFIDGNGINKSKLVTPNFNISPNKYKRKAIPFVIYENNEFKVTQEARELLTQKEYTNIGIISLVGKYRTGKSFLLNRVILNTQQSSGFGVGPTFKPCTKGIWIWSEPFIINNSTCNHPFPCFLIDTEGLGAYDEEINHDSKIFLVAILISSLFIFNSFGPLDENAINTLSFILNLSETIKIRKLSTIDDEAELAEYFPSLLWLLRDFSLKLVDKKGNDITEKQYLENALENINGNTDVIKEKNRVRNLIKTFFPERDCFTMVRPVEKEKDLQNLQNLPDSELRKEFLIQAKEFRKKVFNITNPKSFHKKLLSGSMLVELVQNILDSINAGCIPIIENTWKYVIQNECIKNTENILENFKKEIREYREKNKDAPDLAKNVKNFTKNLYNKYVDEFKNNDLIDDEYKNEFLGKLKNKLNNEINLFDKENEKLFENNFENDLNNLANNFINDLIFKSKNDDYFDFFLEFDNFRQKANALCPNLKNKDDIIYDKIILILKKYFDENLSKTKQTSKEVISQLKLENENQEKIINELENEIKKNKTQNLGEENSLKNLIKEEIQKNKEIEEQISKMTNLRKAEEEKHKSEIINTKNKYEIALRNIINKKNNQGTEVDIKTDQLNAIKKNNERLMILHQKKFNYYENEIKELRNKYNMLLKEKESKENKLNNEKKNLNNLNNSVKFNKVTERNNNFLKSDEIHGELSDFKNYIQSNLNKQEIENKNLIQRIMKDKEIDSINEKELFNKYNVLKQKNNELQTSLNINNSKIKTLRSKLDNLKQNKNIFENMTEFKCKFCGKNFPYQEISAHQNNCINNNIFNNNMFDDKNFDFNPNNLEVKITNCKIKTDEIGKPYVEYILNINYNGTNWKINKKYSDFTQLYNNLNLIYKDVIKLSVNLNNVFNTKDSSYNFNENKMNQLQNFLNEIINTDVINTSKILLKFIQFDKFYLHKNFDEENNDILKDREWFMNKFNINYNKVNANNLIGDLNNNNNNLPSSFRNPSLNNEFKNNKFNAATSANFPQNLYKTSYNSSKFKNIYNDTDSNDNYDDIGYNNKNIEFDENEDENINENYGFNDYD